MKKHPLKVICVFAPVSCKIVEMDRKPAQTNLLKNLVLFAWALLVLAPPAMAATITPAASPCDPDYYESMRARAWLEAQREITQNQNLIFKPDSVLEYTCFNRYLNVLATDAEKMFSETQRWGSILPNNSMDNALENLTQQSLLTYLAQNFEHKFLGDRSTLNYTTEKVQNGGYSCDMMGQVWQAAKCMDFIDKPHDAFFTFEQYATSDDKRMLPSGCGGPLPEWRSNIKTTYVNADPPDGTPWKEDNVKTYLNLLDPANCKDTPAIPTGIRVRRPAQAPTDYLEHVCVPSACYYDAQARRCAPNP